MNVKGVVVTESLTKISTESPVVKLLYALTWSKFNNSASPDPPAVS
jgi:hypothetical protein